MAGCLDTHKNSSTDRVHTPPPLDRRGIVPSPSRLVYPDRHRPAVPLPCRLPVTTDPFHSIGGEQHSRKLLEKHRSILAADARELLAGYPDIVVGLILDDDACEATLIRTALESATGQSLPGRGFICTVPRKCVLDILRVNEQGVPRGLELFRRATRDVL
jgi:hypothetical protein